MPALLPVPRLDPLVAPADKAFVRDLRSLARRAGCTKPVAPRPESASGGPKAATLAALVSAHLPVPPAIVVDLSAWPLSLARVEELKAKTRALLYGGFAVVRTSGAGACGRLDSVADVRTLDDLIAAAERCRAIWLEDSRPRFGAGPAPSGPHIIVQRQIDPLISGFAALSPADSRESTRAVTIDYAAGAIEAMAAGWIDPGRVRVGLRDGAITTLRAWPDGRSQAGMRAHLTPRRLLELARLCVTAGTVLGRATTVEWAIDHLGAPWILAARPSSATSSPEADAVAESPPAAREGVRAGTRRPRWPAVRIVLRLPRPGTAVTLGLATG